MCKLLLDVRETLSALVQRKLKESGLSKAQLASLAGLSRAYITDIANGTGNTQSGQYRPSPDTITKLSIALNIPETEILNAVGHNVGKKGDDSPEIPESVKEAFAREGKLTKKDEILLAGMIETLKEQNREAEDQVEQEENGNENIWKVSRRSVR